MISSRTLAETAIKLSRQPEAEQSMHNFLAFLSTNNFSLLIPQIVQHLKRIQERQKDDTCLHVYTAEKLSQEERIKLQSLVGAEDVSFTEHVDTSLIGGFSAFYDGYMYNGNLKDQVTQLQRMLIK